jgi:hypothetical protein
MRWNALGTAEAEDCSVVVRHRLCRPTANETLLSYCRVLDIEAGKPLVPWAEERLFLCSEEAG